MNINKIHYKVLSEPKKIYFDMSTLEIREKLNVSFKTPTCEDDMTGVFGKYSKLDKLYKVKYIHSRNSQLQPQLLDRYHYLFDVGEDEKGAYIEYVLVYDKLYDPLVRLVYIVAACAIVGYIYYLNVQESISKVSALVLSGVIVVSVFLVFKKSKETKEECEKAEKLFLEILKNF